MNGNNEINTVKTNTTNNKKNGSSNNENKEEEKKRTSCGDAGLETTFYDVVSKTVVRINQPTKQ